jgi:hypothetical protein
MGRRRPSRSGSPTARCERSRCRSAVSVGREYGLLNRGGAVRWWIGMASGPVAVIPILNDGGFMDEVPLVLYGLVTTGDTASGRDDDYVASTGTTIAERSAGSGFRRADAAGPAPQTRSDRGARLARRELGVGGRMKGAPFGTSDRLSGCRGQMNSETAAAAGDRTSVGLTEAVGAKTMWRI